MGKLITVIIPVYNTEQYLDKCIKSVINQSYIDIEIILINDGSVDGSLNIINKYSILDNRILVINKNNTGQGESRNAGIIRSKGEYIFFLDSDDYLDTYCLEKLIEYNQDMACEIVVYNGNSFIDEVDIINNQPYFNIHDYYKDNIIGGEEFFHENMDCISPCLKFYRTRFLLENQILFPNYKYGEDIYFWAKCCLYTKKITYFNYCGYLRRHRKNSVSNTFNINIITERIQSISEIEKLINNSSFRSSPIFKKFTAVYVYRILGAILRLKNVKSKYKLLKTFQKFKGLKIIFRSFLCYKINNKCKSKNK